jgi:hypothetical protein
MAEVKIIKGGEGVSSGEGGGVWFHWPYVNQHHLHASSPRHAASHSIGYVVRLPNAWTACP